MSPRPVQPGDLPSGGRVDIRAEDGLFAAYVFLDGSSVIYDSSGLSDSLDAAVREALEEAGES